MYDAKLFVPFIVVFLLAAFAAPIYNASAGKLYYYPEPKKPEGECVENGDWMAANHMLLLKEWRYNAIRHGAEGGRIYHSFTYGKEFEASTNTCFECHENKEEFCDVCHEYVAVHPECWDCHATPSLVEEKGMYGGVDELAQLFT
ncbi:MAG: sulfate reduction electron transfer complex DsrMKJOP subunit DsrJ [Archaeoglobaceae archaeon]